MREVTLIRRCFQTILDSIKNKKLTYLFAFGGYGKTVTLKYCYQSLEKDQIHAQCIWLDRSHFDRDIESPLLTCLKRYYQDQDIHLNTAGKLLKHYQQAQEIYLFIDQYDQLETPDLIQEINGLIAENLQFLHLVIASRCYPKFKISSLELNQQLSFYTIEDLKFNNNEILELFNSNLPTQHIEMMVHKMHGWPYAVMLCQKLFQDHKNMRSFLEITGQDRRIAGFFTEQVMDLLDENSKNFLTEFAYLEHGSIKLSDYALRRKDSRKYLVDLYHQGAFIDNSDKNYQEFSIHPLFKEFLLHYRQPKKPKYLLSRAAIWSLRHQHYKQAAEYARLSYDQRVESLIIDKTSEVLVRNLGELPTIIHWIKDLKKEKYLQWDNLIYWLAWSLAFSYRWETSKALVDKLRAMLDQDQYLAEGQKAVYYMKLDSVEIALYTFQDKSEICLEKAELWLEQKQTIDPFDKAVVFSAQFLCYTIHNEYDLAQQSILFALDEIKKTDSIYGALWVNMLYGYFLLDSGYFNRAKHVLEKQFYKTLEEIGEHSMMLSTISLLLASIYYENNQLHEAQKFVETGFKYIQNHGLIASAERGIITYAKLEALKGIESALIVFDGTIENIDVYPPRLRMLLKYQQAELLIISNKLNEAIPLFKQVETQNNIIQDHRSSLQVYTSYVQLLIAIESNQKVDSEQLLEQLLNGYQIEKQNYLYCKILILKSYLCVEYHKDENKAARVMKQALELAQANGYFRIFIDFQKYTVKTLEVLHANLYKLPAHLQGFMINLNDHLKLKDKSLHVQHLNFSKREIELLKMLETEYTYKEIGENLHISFSTVKWHVNNIYGKLGVKNRTGAVAIARESGLI